MDTLGVLYMFFSFFSPQLLFLYKTHTVIQYRCTHLFRALNCYSSWRSCQNESVKALNKTCCNRLFRDIKRTTYIESERATTKNKNKPNQKVSKLICMRCEHLNKNCICNFKCFGRWNWVARFTGEYVHTLLLPK